MRMAHMEALERHNNAINCLEHVIKGEGAKVPKKLIGTTKRCSRGAVADFDQPKGMRRSSI